MVLKRKIENYLLFPQARTALFLVKTNEQSTPHFTVSAMKPAGIDTWLGVGFESHEQLPSRPEEK